MKPQFQIGKKKLTKEFLETLKKYFEKSKFARITVLKSARESKADVKKYSEEILKALGKNYNVRVIGFTIVVMRFRKEVKK